MGVSKTPRTKEHRMTAQGKINASTVQTGHRIIVKLYRNDAGLHTHTDVSRTKTGTGVLVARVTGKAKCANRRGYIVITTAGEFYAEPIQTMWLAPEDSAGVKRAHAEALLEDEERYYAALRQEAKAKAEQATTPAAIVAQMDEANEPRTAECSNDWHRTAPARAQILCPECPATPEQEQAELDVPDTDPLEAQAVVDTHSVAATSDAYWTKGCGADILERERTGIHAGAANGVHDFQADPATGGMLCGRLITTPAGTPVICREPVSAALHDPAGYAEYAAKLRAALADWVDEGRKMVVADVEVIRDETGQPSQVAVARVPESGYPSTSYEALPQRVPGAALADAQVAELVEDLADMALAQAVSPAALEHQVQHARAARPGHTAQLQLSALRDELYELATQGLCLAIGAEWGRLEGRWLRVVADSADLEDGSPLRVLEAGDDEPRWWFAGTRSRRTGYVLMVGKTLTVNSRPYEIRHTMSWGTPRLYPV